MDDLTRINGIGAATAKRLVAEGIDTFEKLAHADVKAEWKHQAATIVADRKSMGKPPSPDDEPKIQSRDRADLPADGGAGDPHIISQGSSGTAREAPSTDGGTPATAGEGTQSGSPQTDTKQAANGDGSAPEPGAPVVPLPKDHPYRQEFPLVSASIDAWNLEHPERWPTIIRIKSKRDGFRRCGVAHPKAPTDHPASRFAPDQMERLLAEPMLTVELV
jgi:hypothetical protein